MTLFRTGLCNCKPKERTQGKQLVVGTGPRSVSTGPSGMFSVATEGYHVGYPREFVGTFYGTYGQSNTTITCASYSV